MVKSSKIKKKIIIFDPQKFVFFFDNESHWCHVMNHETFENEEAAK